MLGIRELTAGERLRIARRREDLTQEAAAKQLSIPLSAYRRAEADDAPACWNVPVPALGELRDFEVCHVLRLRKGLTLDDLSARIGLSKWWLCLIEQGKAPVDTLLAYWTRR